LQKSCPSKEKSMNRHFLLKKIFSFHPLLFFSFSLLLLLSFSPFLLFSQPITQNIKGTVTDDELSMPLPEATVIILESDPLLGTTTDPDGKFKIENVPVGRYNIQVSYVGYKPFLAKEIIVSSGKETVMMIGLTESVETLQQVEIKASSNKNEPLNTMSSVSARQVNMEEANRYAGGMDDPARLVSSYAGVSYNMGNNAIVIRGNSPKGLLWRMEGVQIPNPNHFADFITLGGGALTALSQADHGCCRDQLQEDPGAQNIATGHRRCHSERFQMVSKPI